MSHLSEPPSNFSTKRISLQYQKILVTGGTGFVGRRLVSALLHAGVQNILVADRSAQHVGRDIGVASMDLENNVSVERLIAKFKPDVVVHLAAQSSVGHAVRSSIGTWNVNLGGSLALALAMTKHVPYATLLFASSSEIYGNAFNNGTVSEDTLPQPQSSYARSKFAAEQMFVDCLAPTSGLIIVRPSNHSGSGQDDRFVLPSFAKQIASGAPHISVGNLEAERDFLHVDDVVGAYLRLIEAAENLPLRLVVNVASGETRQIGSLLKRLISLSGRAIEIVVDPARLRPSDVQSASLDPARIKTLIDWTPTRDIDFLLSDVLVGQGIVPKI